MLSDIPQPPSLPYLGNLFDINPKHTIKSLCQLKDIYGPIFKLVIVGVTRVCIGNHDLFGELCDEKRFVKSVSGPLGQMRNVAHDGLITAHPGEHNWEIAHRVLLPAFGPIPIQDMFQEMHDIATQLVLKWARQGPTKSINVQEDFTRFTLDSIALCAMGTRFNSFYSEEIHPFVTAMLGFLRESNYRANRPAFANNLLWTYQQQYDRDICFLRTFAKQLLDERRQNPTQKKDILNAMISGRDPKTGEAICEESIIDNMITFLIAGHETTSGALSFLFYHLLKNPGIWQKVQKEVDEVIGNDRVISDHLPRLRYVNACVRETLRLWPTAPAIFFKPKDRKNPTVIGKGNYTLLPGQSIIAILPAIHRDPDVWGKDAEEFRPERMIDENFNCLPKNAWKPFGNGIRACVGRPFAWDEIILITALLAQNFNFELSDPDYELEIDQIVTLRPSNFLMHAKLRTHVDAIELASRLFSDQGSKSAETMEMETKTTQICKDQLQPMTILYGSNTGTCESLAHQFARDAVKCGFSPTTSWLDSAVGKLPVDQPVIIVVASYDGEPAENAANFVSWLQALDESVLSGVYYAILGCGHRDWAATFYRIPKLIDRLLGEAGAHRLLDLHLADVSTGTISNSFEYWSENLIWPAISAKFKLQRLPNFSKYADKLTLELTNNLQCHTNERQTFFEGTILENKLLTGPGQKEKRHLEIKLSADADYAVGDYLNILPTNPLPTIKRVMELFGISIRTHMKVTGGLSTMFPIGKKISVYEALSACVELCQPATTRNIHDISSSVSDPDEKNKLMRLASSPIEVLKKRISVLDILEQAPSATLSFADFLAMLPPLRVRPYSISSSPLNSPDSCSLTVSVVDSEVHEEGGQCCSGIRGIATHFLSNLEPGNHVPCTIRSSSPSFRFPVDPGATPIVMIGAGSSIAPFRAFVQERACRAATGQKLAPALLFHGCRSVLGDRIYGAEFDTWQEDGIVDMRYAYSKVPENGQPRQHVQDRLWQDREILIQMYERGARFYLCGSSGLRDCVLEVTKDIFAIAAKRKGKEKTDEAYHNWLAKMNKKRFAVDIFA